jgi:hypothetical protein
MTNQYITGGENAPLWQEFAGNNPGAGGATKQEDLAATLKALLSSELGPLRQQVASIQSEVAGIKASGGSVPPALQDRLDTLLDNIESKAEEDLLAGMTTEQQLAYLKDKVKATREAGDEEGQGITQEQLMARRDAEYAGFVLPSLRTIVEAEGLLLTPELQGWLERADTPVEVTADGAINWDKWMGIKRTEVRQLGNRVRAENAKNEDSPAREAGNALGSPRRAAAPGGGGRPDFFKSDFDTLFDSAMAERNRQAATAGRR